MKREVQGPASKRCGSGHSNGHASARPGGARRRPLAPRHGRCALALLLLAALPWLAGCSRPAAEGWFPLEAGHRWTYAVRTEREDGKTEREQWVLSTHGAESPEGLDGGPAWRRRSDSGVDYWLRSDPSGIYRVASKTDVESAARPDPAPRYVLKAPYRVGTEWQASTTSYLLLRADGFPRELRHSQPPVPMSYRIEALGDTVEVPAGRFEGCLRVRGEARMRLFADPVQGWRDLPLTTTEWYCPGVGLARLQREEPAGSRFLSGGTLTMELLAWR